MPAVPVHFALHTKQIGTHKYSPSPFAKMVLYFNVLCFYLFIYLIKLKEWKGEPHKGVLQKQSAYGTCVASNM